MCECVFFFYCPRIDIRGYIVFALYVCLFVQKITVSYFTWLFHVIRPFFDVKVKIKFQGHTIKNDITVLQTKVIFFAPTLGSLTQGVVL